MTDVVETLAKLVSGADAHSETDESVYVSIAEDILATLTPGSTWTTEDGVEVMVVPAGYARKALMAYADEVAGTGAELIVMRAVERLIIAERDFLAAIRKE